MSAPMNAPRSTRCPLSVQPIPLPAEPPPAIALINGVIRLSVNALIRVLNASATTSPTAMTIRSPCIRKFLKPRSIVPPRVVRRWCAPGASLIEQAEEAAGAWLCAKRGLPGGDLYPVLGRAVPVQSDGVELVDRLSAQHAEPAQDLVDRRPRQIDLVRPAQLEAHRPGRQAPEPVASRGGGRRLQPAQLSPSRPI